MVSSRFDPWIKQLLSFRAENCFNPWTDSSMDDARTNGPEARVGRLLAHLSSESVKFCLLGEAPGYQGCRITGIPFTSEALVVAGSIPRVPAPNGGLSRRTPAWAEPSARVMWKALHQFGIAESTVMWNAFPIQAFEGTDSLSNRTPSGSEFDSGMEVLKGFLDLFPDVCVLCVSDQAGWSLKRLDREYTRVRHPSYGGATHFERGVEAAVKRSCGAAAAA